MDWTIRFRLERTTPLDDAERQKLAAHVTARAAGFDHAVYALDLDGAGDRLASGQTTLPLSFVGPDLDRLLDALTELRAIVTGATAIVEDDLALVSFDEVLARYAVNAGITAHTAPRAAAAPTPPEIVPPARGVFEDAPFVPVDPNAQPEPFFDPPTPPWERELAPGERSLAEAPRTATQPTTEAEVDPELVRRIRSLATAGDGYDERRSLERQDPRAVAQAGLRVLAEVPDSYDVRAVVASALEKVVDRTPLRADMIALWEGRGSGRDYFSAISRALEPAASDPALVAKLGEIVLASDGDVDRRCYAAQLLGYASAAWRDALPVLVKRARLDRDRTREDARWREDTIEAIGRLRRPEGLPTLILELAADTTVGWLRPVRAMAHCDGEASLPWLRRLFDRPGAAEYVIDDLEEIAGGLDWLRELASHPEPRFRAVAGRYLGRRGEAELPLVAAIWKTLDAVRFEQTSSFREDALEKLGVRRGEPQADWDTLVRQRGFEPRELPPVGDVVAALTAHGDGRCLALERLGRNPDPALLLALVLGLELDEALAARGYPRASSPRWEDWARVVRAWPFGKRYGLISDMSQWVRERRDKMPPQRLSPELEEILVGGAHAFAAQMPDPRFLLAPDEQITLDAAERALIAAWEDAHGARPASTTSPTIAGDEPAILPSDAADLFGVVLERPPPRTPPGTRPDAIEPIEGSADAVAVALVPGCSTCELEVDERPRVSVSFQLENRLARPVQLELVELVLRGADGAPIDHAQRIEQQQFWHFLDVRQSVGFEEGAHPAARAIEILVTHQTTFRQRTLVADLDPGGGGALDAQRIWPFTLRPVEPGYPAVEARLSVFRGASSWLRLEVIVELAMKTALRAPVPVDALIVLRNRGGSVLQTTTERAVLDAAGPVFVHGRIRLSPDELRTARRLEVALSGVAHRTERVGTFTLPSPRPR